MFMTRPICDVGDHKQQHVSGNEKEQGPAPEDYSKELTH